MRKNNRVWGRFINIVTLILMLSMGVITSGALADDLTDAKALFDQRKYKEARAEFLSILSSLSGEAKQIAELNILKCDYFLKDHESLATFYEAHKAEAASTKYEPAFLVVYANSLKDNQKDYAAARVLYEKIVKDFPDSPYAAPGSLLRLGELDLKENKPDIALGRYRELLNKYPDSDYTDNAMIGLMQGYYQLKDRTNMEKIRSELFKKYPDSPQKARAAFLLGEYCISIERNRKNAISYYMECYQNYPDNSSQRLAKIRAADLLPYENVDFSIKLYNETLAERNKLHKDMEAWCELELGFAYLLKGEQEEAKVLFEKVVNTEKYGQKYKNRAQKYLIACNNPDSIEAFDTSFELAFRAREYLVQFDHADRHYENMIRLSKLGVVNSCLKDTAVSNSEKAPKLYQLAIAWYYLSEMGTARRIAHQIVTEYPNEGEITAHAEFLIAFVDYYGGKYEDAINQYLAILEKYPQLSFDIRVLTEIAKCQTFLKQREEAIITLDGLAWLYPWRKEAKDARKSINILITGNDALRQKYQSIVLNNANQSDRFAILASLPPSSFQARIYNVLRKIQLARTVKPVKDIDFEEIILSMK